jgi:hypothetical protein
VKVSDANRMGGADMCSKLTGVGTLNSVLFFRSSSTGCSVYVAASIMESLVVIRMGGADRRRKLTRLDVLDYVLFFERKCTECSHYVRPE